MGGVAVAMAAKEALIRDLSVELGQKVKAFHSAYTNHPILDRNHFAVGRRFDLTVEGFGRATVAELMVYEVKDGQIVVEQFFY